ncbi:hypothetical protein HF324_31920 [Chitinophaga oryzae]|uniref:Uncharacterized protein n=1 Tax=Chitinophaga oryzae TaxID=2725414 RepID=A0AAE6ZLW0_9BACT|nr:hypothetical protein [Chitinophaga oryzae]QJB35661.1 hypothetical protein HF329_31920 [Chitinophaga oryzae]QJB42200.1 hypothetical protein HF324_31920 [Chitinophaga oryzae]
MKKRMIIITLLIAGCGNSNRQQLQTMMQDTNTGLVTEKNIGGTVVTCTYLPRCWDHPGTPEVAEADSELSFKVHIRADKPGMKEKSAQQAANYGLEEVFQLVADEDTLSPVIAQRIANGNMGGVEYLVTWQRPALEKKRTAALIFKDQVFTTTRLVFPLKINSLLQSDSLSCRL